MRRHVSIHLTPWAPGVDDWAIGARCRWITHWSVEPVQSIGDLVDRLQRPPGRLMVRDHAGEVEILGPAQGQQSPVVLAIVAEGLDLAEVAQALATLTARDRARHAPVARRQTSLDFAGATT